MLVRKCKKMLASKKVRRICFGALLIFVLRYFHIGRLFLYETYFDHFSKNFFVKTSGCHMMAMYPFPMKALECYRRVEDRNCNGSQLFRSETFGGKNYLVLSMSETEITRTFNIKRITQVRCKYESVIRINDKLNRRSNKKAIRLQHHMPFIQVEDGPRVLRIYCFVNNARLVYHDVHFFLPSLEAQPKSSSKLDRLSVMILGIDSVSHMHFIRSMPFTAAFIREQPHVEFWGYNRVGLNSYPNIVPLLAGLNEDELEADCYQDKSSFDKCKFLWNHFKDAGYNTSYGEDTSWLGTFAYFKAGFQHQPTDFYLRPTMLEAYSFSRYSLDERDQIFCSAGRKFGEILHEFIYKLMPHMEGGPHFSFFWQTQGVHNFFNYAQLLDESYWRLFQQLYSRGILNSTFVVFLADHGLRFGSFRNSFQGMLEESQPFLIALYPKWFGDAFPMALSNLRLNAHSLVTTFDIHATLKDLTSLELLSDVNIAKRMEVLKGLGTKIPRGINLFLPIPDMRNCDLAGIPGHFCLCRNLRHIPTTDKRSQQAAGFVLKSINMLTQNYPLCQRLQLNELQESYILNKHGIESEFDIKVRVQTIPGEGLFEATIRFMEGSLSLNGAITRVNRYGNQSYCVHNYHIEMYCYCL